MKTKLPTPVAIGVVVLVLIGICAFLWTRATGQNSNKDIANIANSIKSTRTDLPDLGPPPGAISMGGGKKGTERR